ncbi:hypothetical protein VCR4J2_510062 [Vibrio coralliirubri]|nr:hypothetical protein VCR4J2_510062 [Vibrio coralliirubri]
MMFVFSFLVLLSKNTRISKQVLANIDVNWAFLIEKSTRCPDNALVISFVKSE